MPSRPTTLLMVSLLVLLLVGAAGCANQAAADHKYMTHERLQNGLVIILPGIEGRGVLSQAVRTGLVDANINQGLRYYDWGWPVPVAGLVLNQMDTNRARKQAAKLALIIQEYQGQYPGRPVHMVGHSGGAAVAVFAAEQLPEGSVIDGVIMLRPSLSVGYDLSKALNHTCKGIVNFWSPADVALLMVGTTVFGNLDGVHGPAGGAMGFIRPSDSSKAELLHQFAWSMDQILTGNLGGHFTVAASSFVKEWVAPWIQVRDWPAESQQPTLNTQPAASEPDSAPSQSAPAAGKAE